MSAAQISGVVVEVGPSDEEGNFICLECDDAHPNITIDGLTDDEARAFAMRFGQLVTLTIGGAS